MKNKGRAEAAAQWRRLSSYSRRKLRSAGRLFDVVEYSYPSPSAESVGARLVFFSDLHWTGSDALANELEHSVSALNPDWLLFGGDLSAHACHFQSAFALLASLNAKKGKLAVLGNWDKRRRRWFPFRLLVDYYEKAGFRLLVNEGFRDGDFYFYGADDFKLGNPLFPPPPDNCFSCVLSHNPDAHVLSASHEALRRTNVFLSGHTHGGQICLPCFGALVTSSLFWKKFEYGRFKHRECGAEMIVSSGLGTSACPVRLFRRPELVLLSLS